MFRRVLIANRGEVALRVIRACHDLGAEAVVVHSTADRDLPYVDFADEAVCIGPPEAAQSYLNVARLLTAAEIADVDAIHPGYGFLAERASFAEVCASCDVSFIGPPPQVIAACGDKAAARALAIAADVPVVPGSDGALADADAAVLSAREIGYPVILKAAAGGGGRGMRVAHNEVSLVHAFHQAQAEAHASFGDSRIYLEKFVQNTRHIEFQILAGADGEVVHLGERDCSIQRRHQKLLEEAPSPALSPKLRRKMGAAAVKFAQTAGYINAGTVEFLLCEDESFYFIEMNARIQVEHCVTEMVTGLDLVQWQLRIAAGESLDFSQEEVVCNGHAMEFRINAEDPDRGFAPCPGNIERLFLPGGPGVRVDTCLQAGSTIPRHYDSLVAKLIVHGRDRADTIRIGRRALAEVRIQGPGLCDTAAFQRRLLDHPDFIAGQIDTGFLDRYLED